MRTTLRTLTLTAGYAMIGFGLGAMPAAAETERPAGWEGIAAAYGCDPDGFTAIRSPSGDVLYWNNRTCTQPGQDGAGGSAKRAERWSPDEDEKRS